MCNNPPQNILPLPPNLELSMSEARGPTWLYSRVLQYNYLLPPCFFAVRLVAFVCLADESAPEAWSNATPAWRRRSRNASRRAQHAICRASVGGFRAQHHPLTASIIRCGRRWGSADHPLPPLSTMGFVMTARQSCRRRRGRFTSGKRKHASCPNSIAIACAVCCAVSRWSLLATPRPASSSCRWSSCSVEALGATHGTPRRSRTSLRRRAATRAA